MVKYKPIDEMGEIRKNLLNLTLRNNNLLNYKVSTKRTLQVAGMSAEALYDALVNEDKKLKVSIKKEVEANTITMTDTAEALEQKLIYINRQANSIREEQGYSVLYLAIGFLQWKDSDNGKTPISPILLIPVELTRTGRTKVFYVKWTGEDIFTSMTLQMKMNEKHIGIPDFTMKEGKERGKEEIKEYFNEVKEAIRTEKELKVLNEIRLDLFDFKKFVMYKDIDPALWTQEEIDNNYPLIKKVFGLETDKYMVQSFNPANIDNAKLYKKSFNVVDADSSQVSVIEDIKNGHCMVVIGPPGTGKSQTIVNTIAECIAQGKSVLFVCEKMAALKVVKERLDRIGLGELCLELHSDETKKKAVLASIEKSLSRMNKIETYVDVIMMKIFHERKELNSYASALREQIGEVYPNFYTLYGVKEDIRLKFCEKGIDIMPIYDLNNPEKWTISEWYGAKNAISMIIQWASLMPVKERIWYGCEPELILPTEIKKIDSLIIGAISSYHALSSALEEIASVLKVEKPKTVMQIKATIAKVVEPINKSNEFDSVRNSVRNIFSEEIFNIDFSEFELLSNNLFKMFSSKYKMLNEQIKSCYIAKKSTNDDEIVRDLKQVQLYKKLKIELESVKKESENDHVCKMRALDNVREKENNFYKLFSALNNILKINVNVIFGVELRSVDLNALCALMHKWHSEIESNDNSNLTIWSQYIKYRKNFMETKAAYLINDFENGTLHASDMWNVFEGNYVDELITKNIRDQPILSGFTKMAHDNKIANFHDLDMSLLIANRQRVLSIAFDEMKNARDNPSNQNARYVLETEFNKKSRHMPIRKLMRASGKLIQKIKPCFMMSPITVAQYLDPKGMEFDVIVFDEASQIRPEDAIGTLLRGKQLIVMGDPKQLPPTSFFDSVIEDEDFDECDSGDMESILNLCKRNFITKNLSWHYRSRHESLIAVSNTEFYESDLQVYPSPSQKDTELGLKFEYHPETVYERGTTGVNRKEAKIVAEAVYEHYKMHPEKSLGVGTFNIKQQAAIQEEIDNLKQKNAKVKIPDDGEYFFVKNLETIQGDERDVIYLSIGFGFDTQKKLSMNFGALNKEGGERRLNVLITRAREKCVIFSNFRAQDLKPENLTSVGLKCLRSFMEFAESREFEEYNDKSDADRAFEESVYLYLKKNKDFRDRGYEIHRNVGCSGYKMDIAITDPNNKGNYILGIECDGEKYFGSMVCRDRDRLKETILRGLGWNLCRVWSTDWYMYPRKSRTALLDGIKNVILEKRIDIDVKNETKSVISTKA